MAQSTGEARENLGSACSGAPFFVASRRQFWGDIALVAAAILVPAFLSRALRHHETLATTVALLAVAVGVLAWLFLRQLLRGERGWMFYTAMLLFSGLSERGDKLAEVGVESAWVATMAMLAAAPAAIGIVGAVRIVQALDEMWRQINYRALAFAFIGTLSLVLGQWLLARLGVEILTWRWLLLLMVALWGAGMAWGYRRFK